MINIREFSTDTLHIYDTSLKYYLNTKHEFAGWVATINVVETHPMYGEVYGLARIHEKPTVPPGVIGLPHSELLTREPLSVLLDEGHDGLRSGKEDFPCLSAVLMGRDELVNAGPDLAAVRDCPADWDFGSRAERTSVDFERDFTLLERTEESAVSEFCLDIDANILGSDGSGSQITLGVFWIWRRSEGEIPPELQHGKYLVRVEVSLESKPPSLEREGGTRQRNAEAIHVCR